MIVGGLAGIVTGAIIARNPVRSGVSSAAQGGSTWGSIYGAMIAGMFEPDDGDSVLVTSLIAGNIGLITGGLLGSRYGLSRERVRVINLGALVGGVAGLGVDLLVQPDDEQVALGIPLAFSIAGLAIAAQATRDSDLAPGQGGDGANALFSYDDGSLNLGVPLPLPTFMPAEDSNRRTVWRPGVTLNLLRARF